jgi:glycosyltransferase involved in cell wall biosynthesis
MRILVATHLIPFPPDTGGKIVSAQTLACLRQLGTLDMCAFDPPWRRGNGPVDVQAAATRSAIVPLRRRPLSWWPLEALRGRPYYIFRDDSAEMRRRLACYAQDRPDLLVADSLHMAHYVSGLQGPKVLVEHNVESYLVGEYVCRHRNPLIRTLGRIERRHLEHHERDQCNRFDAVIVLSAEDRQRLVDLGVRVPVVVLPPAVELVDPVPDGPDRQHVVHIGTGHWPPIAEGLRWYLGQVHPVVRRHAPHAEVWLVGAPPPFLRPGHVPDGVRVLGYMTDLENVYRKTAVFIVPLLVGGGVRLKILHALARGLAVVSTAAGCEGLGLENGTHLLTADDPLEFAQAVLRLLRDAELRRRLGTAGRAHVLARFRPDARCANLCRVLEQAVGRWRKNLHA